MGSISIFNGMIEEKLLNLRTAYIGKVLSFDGTCAAVQPLGVVKQYGKPAVKQAIVSDVPVVASARYKTSRKHPRSRFAPVTRKSARAGLATWSRKRGRMWY